MIEWFSKEETADERRLKQRKYAEELQQQIDEKKKSSTELERTAIPQKQRETRQREIKEVYSTTTSVPRRSFASTQPIVTFEASPIQTFKLEPTMTIKPIKRNTAGFKPPKHHFAPRRASVSIPLPRYSITSSNPFEHSKVSTPLPNFSSRKL